MNPCVTICQDSRQITIAGRLGPDADLSFPTMKKIIVISLVALAMHSQSQAQQDALQSNVPAHIRAMIEQSQANSGANSMARMQVDVQFGEFLTSLAGQPQKRDQVQQALTRVIAERLELSNEVATGQGSTAALETLSSYAYLRGQLAPLLSDAELDLLDEQQGAVAERNLRQNYGEQLVRLAPDVTEENRAVVLDVLVPAMLFRRDNADQRNQLTPDQIVQRQLMSLREAREVLQGRLTGIQLEQVNSFFNQIRSNLFLNQSMYDSVQ